MATSSLLTTCCVVLSLFEHIVVHPPTSADLFSTSSFPPRKECLATVVDTATFSIPSTVRKTDDTKSLQLTRRLFIPHYKSITLLNVSHKTGSSLLLLEITNQTMVVNAEDGIVDVKVELRSPVATLPHLITLSFAFELKELVQETQSDNNLIQWFPFVPGDGIGGGDDDGISRNVSILVDLPWGTAYRPHSRYGLTLPPGTGYNITTNVLASGSAVYTHWQPETARVFFDIERWNRTATSSPDVVVMWERTIDGCGDVPTVWIVVMCLIALLVGQYLLSFVAFFLFEVLKVNIPHRHRRKHVKW
eukprot:PhM_4_TR13573/c0_g1_i1/m.90283